MMTNGRVRVRHGGAIVTEGEGEGGQEYGATQ
jgi:hypothetical protein